MKRQVMDDLFSVWIGKMQVIDVKLCRCCGRKLRFGFGGRGKRGGGRAIYFLMVADGVVAMLFAYAMRHVRRLFPIFIVLNTLMVISTPSHGGHYVVDVVAGVAVGVLAVWISRKVFARTASSAEVSTLAVGRA